jgi:hypothetical protein
MHAVHVKGLAALDRTEGRLDPDKLADFMFAARVADKNLESTSGASRAAREGE